ncbi:MAG: hypothetical protein WD423_10765 [Rhodothermales bacterium]
MIFVNAKINRAIELFRELNAEVERWKNSGPIEVLQECNKERTQFVTGVRFRKEPDALKWSIIAGDILFNLRCALDHLVFYLAIVDSGKNPPERARRLMFPVTNSDDQLEGAIGARRLFGCSEETIDYIRSVQPYVAFDDSQKSPLRTINYLNNVDKHRHLHMSVFSVVGTEAELTDLPEGTVKVSVNDQPLEKEDWVISIETDTPSAGPEGTIGFSIRFGLLEDRFKGRQLLEVLKEAIDYVVEIAKPYQA